MEGTGKHPAVHCCSCSGCRVPPVGPTAKPHRALNDLVATLDEQSRRLVVGLLARPYGRGGITPFARITGLSRDTRHRHNHRRRRVRPLDELDPLDALRPLRVASPDGINGCRMTTGPAMHLR